jgi:hypothetical protein
MQLAGLSTSSRTPAQAWDGVHVFLRYHDQNNLYTVDLARRDGVLTIKRKTAPPGTSDTGDYQTLAQITHPLGPGAHSYQITIGNRAAGVQISLDVDGVPVLSTVDRNPGALADPGRIGIRGDNADFTVSQFAVHPG